MKNKGLSSVIASILLVLITIAMIIILSNILIPFVKDSLSKSSECKFYEESYVFDSSFNLNCKNGSQYIFSIENKNGDVNGFDILLVSDDVKKKYSVRMNSSSDGIKMINGDNVLNVPKKGEIESYNINDSINYKIAEIYPFSGTKSCTKSDEVNLKIC
jgi:FlaG/FlaF family flagellin (archaellin)